MGFGELETESLRSTDMVNTLFADSRTRCVVSSYSEEYH